MQTRGTRDSLATTGELCRPQGILKGKIRTVQGHEDDARLRAWRTVAGEGVVH